MTLVGSAAGAALGFILGDIPGAVLGAEFGYNAKSLYSSSPMAPKRKATSVSSRKPKKQKKEMKTTKWKRPLAKRRGSVKRRYTKITRLAHVLQDMTLIKFRMPGPRRKKHSFAGRIRFTDTYTGIITGDLGVQTVATGRYFHHRNQLIVVTPDAGAENDRSTSATNVFELNPNRSTSGNTELGAVSNAPQSETIYCSYQKSSMSLSNLENIAIHCEVYWLMAKIDSTAEPTDVWATDMTNLSLTQTVMGQTTLASGTPTPGYPTSNLYGEDPTTNISFKRYWKVMAKKEFVLPMGMTVRFEFTRPVNKLIKRADISGLNMVKGMTFVPMFIFKPAPVVAKVSSEVDSTQVVNTGPTRVGYMQYDTAYYHVQKDKTIPINRSYTGNWTATVAQVTAEVMEPDGDNAPLRQAIVGA